MESQRVGHDEATKHSTEHGIVIYSFISKILVELLFYSKN